MLMEIIPNERNKYRIACAKALEIKKKTVVHMERIVAGCPTQGRWGEWQEIFFSLLIACTAVTADLLINACSANLRLQENANHSSFPNFGTFPSQFI